MMNIEIVIGSITEQDVDGIVNSANTSLVMGGGVAAAILAEAGSEVEEEAMAQGPVDVGDVVVTGGGELPVRHILHVAVVGGAPPDIYECTMSVLDRAADLGIRSLAFPALGTGSARLSVRDSASAMCQALADFAAAAPTPMSTRIVIWDDAHFQTFERALRRALRGGRNSAC